MAGLSQNFFHLQGYAEQPQPLLQFCHKPPTKTPTWASLPSPNTASWPGKQFRFSHSGCYAESFIPCPSFTPPPFLCPKLIPSVETSPPSRHTDACPELSGVKHCNRLPWEVMRSPSLEISEVSLNMTLRNWPDFGVSPALSRKVGEGTNRGSFQPSLF